MRQPMTFDEHQRAAELLDVIDARIRQLLNLMNDRRGLSVRLIDAVLKANRALDLARAGLDTLACKQLPNEFTTTIYYPERPRTDIETNAGEREQSWR